MNRREALAFLAAVPASTIVDVQRVNLQSSDVILVQCEYYVTPENAERIKASLQEAFPNNKVLVYDRAIALKVLRDGVPI